MENPLSFSSLFDQAGCDFVIYDLSRRICEIPNQTFIDVEANRQAYPYPIQQKAQLAIAYWQDRNAPWIWFLNFPLDERGLLNQAILGDFIQWVAKALGARLENKLTDRMKKELANNPYLFQPNEDKRAIFHAKLTQHLQQAPSQYYCEAQRYLAGEHGWENWQGIGLQGIADVCERLDKDNNTQRVKSAMSKLPMQPLYALLGCLEHVAIPKGLAEKLNDNLTQMLNEPEVDLYLVCAHLRALAGGPKKVLIPHINHLLSEPLFAHDELFITIAGRCWHALEAPGCLQHFFKALSAHHHQRLTTELYIDLVMQPRLRPLILGALYQQEMTPIKAIVMTMQQQMKEA